MYFDKDTQIEVVLEKKDEVKKEDNYTSNNNKSWQKINSLADAINYLGERDIMIGDNFGNFDENGLLKRSQMAQILSNLDRDSINPTSMDIARFEDVTKDNWFFNAVQRMSALKVFVGKSKHMFKPNDTLTVGEFAVLTYKAFNLETSNEQESISGSKSWNDGAIRALNAKINLKDLGITNANAPITRGQVAIILAVLDSQF